MIQRRTLKDKFLRFTEYSLFVFRSFFYLDNKFTFQICDFSLELFFVKKTKLEKTDRKVC